MVELVLGVRGEGLAGGEIGVPLRNPAGLLREPDEERFGWQVVREEVAADEELVVKERVPEEGHAADGEEGRGERGRQPRESGHGLRGILRFRDEFLRLLRRVGMMTSAPLPRDTRLSGSTADRAALVTALLITALATLAAFLPSLRNGFIPLDDVKNFLANPHYRGLGLRNLAWMFTAHHTGHYVPFTWLTLGLDYTIWGMNPVGYHLTSLLFHAANGLLFCGLAWRVFKRVEHSDGPSRATGRGRALAATTAALFFAVHPLRVESVAWASERRDVVCGFFVLAAIHAYLSAATTLGRSRIRWLGLSLAAFVAALFSKGLAVMLPVALVALDIGVLGRLPRDMRSLRDPEYREAIREKLLYLAPAALFSAVTFWAIAYVLSPVGEMGMGSRFLSAAYGLSFYVERTMWPFDLPLLVNRVAPLSIATPGVAIRLAAVVAVAIALVVAVRRLPRTALAVAVYAAFILPVSGLFQAGPQLVAHRYSYLATMPLALLVGAGMHRLSRREGAGTVPALALAGLLACTAVGLVLLTRRQVGFYRDGVTFATEAVRGAPHAWRPRYHHATALAASGRFAEAVRSLRVALLRFPDNGELAVTAALLLTTSPDDQLRNPDEAARLAERAGRLLGKDDPRPPLALSAAWAERRDFEAARRFANEAANRARARGDGMLADRIEGASEGYRSGHPLCFGAADWGRLTSVP